jgi:hypothetical protein
MRRRREDTGDVHATLFRGSSMEMSDVYEGKSDGFDASLT